MGLKTLPANSVTSERQSCEGVFHISIRCRSRAGRQGGRFACVLAIYTQTVRYRDSECIPVTIAPLLAARHHGIHSDLP
eukprot:6176417-Pleurochrysis_carterae.AAC.1